MTPGSPEHIAELLGPRLHAALLTLDIDELGLPDALILSHCRSVAITLIGGLLTAHDVLITGPLPGTTAVTYTATLT
jgi:hypothetical protein